MEDLPRWKVEAVFWSMAALIMLLAMAAAVIYSTTDKEYKLVHPPQTPLSSGEDPYSSGFP